MEDWNKKLIEAAKEGRVEELKLCLANGANIDYQQVNLNIEYQVGHESHDRTLMFNTEHERQQDTTLMFHTEHERQQDTTLMFNTEHERQQDTPLMFHTEHERQQDTTLMFNTEQDTY
ncbi:Hypothetical predicted protein [Mytilus galloprovincialis]|uniref:Uncharacterized protein n=1 Tax=Mytilus galloprovincialis TaxID=29158 RepID=A0A8B6BVC8_MYTGA|nr:Hypothetical predicted protein [Mytilus galloprovincialis]